MEITKVLNGEVYGDANRSQFQSCLNQMKISIKCVVKKYLINNKYFSIFFININIIYFYLYFSYFVNFFCNWMKILIYLLY